MWCYYFDKNHGLLILLYVLVGIDSLTSSRTECNCPTDVQNAQCSIETDCKVACNDGYWGKSCQFGRTRLTSSHGYITDGAESYTKLSKRIWFIDARNRRNASIYFQVEKFVTECNWDHLYIFDGDSTDAPVLAAFSGHLQGDVNSTSLGRIPQEIVAKSGSAFVYFYSDLGEVRSGFNISYRIVDECECSNGRCNTAGLCVCNVGWTGTLCNIKMNCSNLCMNGVCNETSGNCHCFDHYTGDDCSKLITSSYWSSFNIPMSEISPRSSHAAAVIGDYMWVYSGYRSSGNKYLRYRNLHRYNLKDKTWTTLSSEEDFFLWGHSMVAYKNKLIVFGGERQRKDQAMIINRLAVFDTNSSTWSHLDSSPVPVMGHTATLVGDKMIVLFGLNEDGLFSGVQEYDIVKSEWMVVKNFTMARHGHTSVYDPFSKAIYVYGGVMMRRSIGSTVAFSSDSLALYYPISRKWITLASSGYTQTLHSAVIVDQMMIVFGGNRYNTPGDKDISCRVSTLHVYDLVCQKWHSEKLPQIAQNLARYGHTAVTHERTMYAFAGFNGALFNDILTYTHGDCERIVNETECMEKYFSAGCYWNNSHCVTKDSLKTLAKCPAKHKKVCSEMKSCDECSFTPHCGWTNKTCQVDGNDTCPAPTDICHFYFNCKSCRSVGCHWSATTGCQRQLTFGACDTSCHDLKTSKMCTSSSTCLWCESLQRCVDSRLYVVHYPYGQCLEWTTSNPNVNQEVSCGSKVSCQDCFTLPSCGWSESATRDGAGQCLRGGVSGPKDFWNYKYWNFFRCPLCQCNGHSNCSFNSSACLQCRDHTTGGKCDTCAAGYFGNPRNGGRCEPCQCNGHADTCTPDKGVCTCRMRGVKGDHCDKCLSSSYVGNATNGGSCYYQLTPDYLYRINISEETIFNFICSPRESDKNTVVTVDISKGDPFNPAMLNISVGSDILPERHLLTNVELSSRYEEKFSKDQFPFGSEDFHFKIYVYNISPFSTISVSVHQPNDRGIDLLKFFIIFLVCFVGLLILAVIVWKVKAFCDTFRRTRRRNVELVYMTNRPFAFVPICVDKPGHVPMKTKPTPLTSEICCGSKAAVATVLVRLPICAQTENSSGAASLCLGSTLVNYNEHQSSKMVDYMKNIKRRRNPFRPSRT